MILFLRVPSFWCLKRVAQSQLQLLHKPLPLASEQLSLRLDQGVDRRLVRCQRPIVITGGELTMDMLDVRFDPYNRQYQAPLQLKASNGIFIIDDLGRQRMPPLELFNRWIVPMEEKKDFLNLGGGRHCGKRPTTSAHPGTWRPRVPLT